MYNCLPLQIEEEIHHLNCYSKLVEKTTPSGKMLQEQFTFFIKNLNLIFWLKKKYVYNKKKQNYHLPQSLHNVVLALSAILCSLHKTTGKDLFWKPSLLVISSSLHHTKLWYRCAHIIHAYMFHILSNLTHLHTRSLFTKRFAASTGLQGCYYEVSEHNTTFRLLPSPFSSGYRKHSNRKPKVYQEGLQGAGEKPKGLRSTDHVFLNLPIITGKNWKRK